MKKNPKSDKPTAPATKSVASTPAPAPKPVAAVPTAAPKPAPAAAAPKAAATPAAIASTAPAPSTTPAPKPVAAPAPAPVAAPVKKAVTTVISATIDVGFGHALYVRGEGGGLSWNRGLALKNVSADKWSWTFSDVSGPITFKFLIDDAVWSVGENYVAVPGASLAFQPVF
jgi:hypothetical protein